MRPWPTVDRPAPREAMLAALDIGRSILVVGEDGVGKTHLVTRVLADRAARRGALDPRLTDSGPALAAAGTSGLPRDADSMTIDPTQVDGWEVMEGIRLATTGQTLERAAGHPGHVVRVFDQAPSTPVMLHVEDAHLLDRATSQALALMVRQGEVILIATMRPAGAKASPWIELWKDGAAERIDLRPLTPAETEILVEDALGSPVTGDTVRRIWRQTQGNPHYVRELIRHEVETGALVERDGVWIGLVGAGPGQRILDAVGRDLDRLPAHVRSALELIALAEPIAVSMLDGLVDGAVLEELEDEGLVTTGKSPDGPFGVGRAYDDPISPIARLSPPAYADAVRALVPLARRRQLFAQMLAARPGFPTDHALPSGLLRSVLWALECDSHQSGDRLLRAMRAAFSLSRPEAVVQIGSAALRQPLGGAGVRIDILLLRARAWRLLGEPERAAADLLDATERLGAEHSGAEHRLRQIHLAEQTADLHQYNGDAADGSLDLIDRLLGELEEGRDHELRSALEVCRLVRLGGAGRFSESIEPSLALLEAAGYGSAHVLGLAAPTVVGLAQTGRIVEASELGARSLAAARVHEQQAPLLVAGIRASVLLAHLWAGEIEAADRIAAPRGDGDWSHYLQYAADNTGRGMLAAARGLWSEALREHHTAVASLGLLDPSGFALVRRRRGGGGRRRARRQGGCASTHGRRETGSAPGLGARRRGPSAVDRGRPALGRRARGACRGARARALERGAGARRIELEALHRVLVAGHLDGLVDPTDGAVLARMDRLGEVVTGLRAKALLAHAAAMVARDDELVAVAARDLGSKGLWLPSVRSSAHLTPSEREIAGLAAGGLSSRAIAERLTLSVRTVDSHLSRVFTKLGVRSRRELRGLGGL